MVNTDNHTFLIYIEITQSKSSAESKRITLSPASNIIGHTHET